MSIKKESLARASSRLEILHWMYSMGWWTFQAGRDGKPHRTPTMDAYDVNYQSRILEATLLLHPISSAKENSKEKH